MRLAQFIRDNVEAIVVEFAAFARSLVPSGETMSVTALRDHASSILLAIADDMESPQSEEGRRTKSHNWAVGTTTGTSASAHGAHRQISGFDLRQLGGEFRALRAAVLRRWQQSGRMDGEDVVEEMTRFNEGIDQAVAESISAYSAQMSESREMFLAVLGHDLRSPLGSLAGCLQLLHKFEPVGQEREKAFAIAHRSVANIDMMITDLLEYTRTRLGRGIEVLPVWGDLGVLCEDTFDEMKAAYASRSFEFESSGELMLAFDGARMRQVLTNLLGNAVQHGDANFPVRLTVRGAADVTVEVSNKGVPIPQESLQVIFDPLVQISARKTAPNERPATSLGLGLYIAREIVRAHGGYITVTSSVEAGTTFSIRMPRT